MKTPVRWLGEFIDVDAIGVEKLADILTMAGLEVEELHDTPLGRVYVTKTTPNRGDWLSIQGVAREAAAAMAAHGGIALTPTKLPIKKLSTAPLEVPISIDNPEWCPRYAAMIVEINTPGIAPKWIQDRLIAAGMRSINAVVDVTNYVMLELGQPLHAFDLDTLDGPEIIVRSAKEGEQIITLDGKERALNPSMLVIADRAKPIALAGLMGGANSEVTESTKRVLVESAHFNPMIVRAAAKALGLSTDASYRFERFVDPNGVTDALSPAANLIAEFTDGRITEAATDLYPTPILPRKINLRQQRAEAILGMSLDGGQGDSGLVVMGFGFEPADAGSRTVTVPTYRPDVTREIDIIEEIGRMIGYDRLPATLPPVRSTSGGHDSPDGIIFSKLRSLLIGQGLTEVFTHTLSAPSPFDDSHDNPKRVRIRTALSAELSGLRQSLIPNLIEVLGRNVRNKTADINIFEVGKVFGVVGEHQYAEFSRAAILIQGDYLTAKGILDNVLAGLNAPNAVYSPATRIGLHPSRSASLTLAGEPCGFIGEINPYALDDHLDLPKNFGRVSVFELDIEAVLRHATDKIRYHHAPKFPSVSRDLAMVFDLTTPYGAIEKVAKAAAGEFVESVGLVSVYTGDKIEAGKKSVAIRLTLRAEDRTLTDSDADLAISAAKAALQGEFGGEQR